MTPAISIGMPVYNGADHLGQALESLLAQSCRNFEIIISDNASSDTTSEIITEFAKRDARIRPVRQDENIGAVANFKCVLELAKAPFFMWAAYDDWHDANYLEALLEALEKNPDAEMAVPRIIQKRKDGTVAEDTATPPMPDKTRIGRISRMLSLTRGGSIYGLYRTEPLRRAYARSLAGFPFVWAADHLIIFPFYVNDRVIGVPHTRFYNRDTGISVSRYRPETLREQWRFQCGFIRYAANEVIQSRLKLWEKFICLLFLIKYSNAKAVKWRRLLRRLIMTPFASDPAARKAP